MSAAIASRRRPSRMASAMKGSSSMISTRTLGCYEQGRIAGVSEIAYVPATSRCLQWLHDQQENDTSSDPADPGAEDARGPAHRGRRHRHRRNPRLEVRGMAVLAG